MVQNFTKLTHIDRLENKHAMQAYIFVMTFDVCKWVRKKHAETRMRNIFALHMIPIDVKKLAEEEKDYENRCKECGYSFYIYLTSFSSLKASMK